MEQSEDKVDDSSEVKLPGRILAEARRERGMSVEDVAAALRLSARTVASVEEDRYEALPPDIFVRGYLRAYARLLELDPAPLLEAFAAHSGGGRERPLQVRTPVQTAPDMSRWMRRAMPIALGVLVLGAGGAWLVDVYRDMGSPVSVARDMIEEREQDREPLSATPETDPVDVTQPAAIEESVTVESGSDIAEPDPDDLFRDEPGRPPEQWAESDEGVAAEWPEVPLDGDVPERAAPSEPLARLDEPEAPDTVPEADDPEAVANGVSRETLTLRFSGPSWVEVYDGNGDRLLYGLIDDLDQRSLEGRPPFSIVIGDTGHVSLEHEGRPVDLGEPRPGRVARLQVPR